MNLKIMKEGSLLESSFDRMMVFGEGGEMGVRRVSHEWKHIPMDLLMRIVSLVDDRTILLLLKFVVAGERPFSGGIHISPSLGIFSTYRQK